ncbi:MFS transporter [Pseudonocardia sp.]|uniref:MFS transporter n=1 Tax=Pseudonocardia sp. TaxID=60912 RepID=UPI0025D3F163|nr:MFS transporter [Pseudonocardia sp.]
MRSSRVLGATVAAFLPRPGGPQSRDHKTARSRGRVDIAVNGTYWFGAILGTLGTFILLDAVHPSLGWRLGFLLGPVLGLIIVVVRRNLPESPRWQIMNGKREAAEGSITYIEDEVRKTGRTLPDDGSRPVLLFIGYLMGAVIMAIGGLVAWFLGVDAEGKALEDVVSPLGVRKPVTRAPGAGSPSSG